MTGCYKSQIFIRHHRQLRALLLENQAWFCLQDTARLMGKALDERATWKLDPDQRRTAWLNANGECTQQLLISESGLFAMLVHHYVPENRALRHWLTHEVLPTLRDKTEQALPSMSSMRWSGSSVGLLEWQSDYWVRLRDLPELIAKPVDTRGERKPSRFSGLWRAAWLRG